MTPSTQPVAAIILAAGASTRLGSPKQLLRVDGQTLLRRTIETALAAECSPVIVVLGAQSDLMLTEMEGLQATAITNAGWPEGMASSLRSGLAELTRQGKPQQDVLLLVCDQPAVTPHLLTSLLATHRRAGKGITACEYSGTHGVPAIFSPEVLPELLAVEGDRGARSIIARDPSRVATFPFPAGAVDIDTPEDVRQL